MSDKIIEEIEILGKRLHQFSEMFELACKSTDSMGASEVVGRIVQTIPELRIMARKVESIGLLDEYRIPMGKRYYR